MILRLRQKQNRRDDDALWRAKKEFMALCGVHPTLSGKQYLFAVDTEEADMDDVRRLAEAVIVPEDYERYFIQQSGLPEFLDEIAHKLDFQNFLPYYIVTADIARLTTVSQTNTLMEVTMHADGSSRLLCVIPTHLVQNKHLKEDMRIRMKGSMQLYQPHARLEFRVSWVIPLDGEETAYRAFCEDNRFDLEAYEDEHPRRRKISVRDTIGSWESLDILTAADRTMDDFESILQSREIGLTLCVHPIPFKPDTLAFKIRELSASRETSAIAIVRGPSRDRYTFWALNDRDVCAAINESPVPVLMGIGHKEDIPLACRYTDYNADTAGMLASRIAYWYAQAKLKQEEEQPPVLPLETEKPSGPQGFWKKVRNLLPW